MGGLAEILAQEVALCGSKGLLVEPGQLRTDFAGPSGKRNTPRMRAHHDAVGLPLDSAAGMSGTQTGDPAKVGAAAFRAVAGEITAMRSAASSDGIREHAEVGLAELSAWEAVLRDVESIPSPPNNIVCACGDGPSAR